MFTARYAKSPNVTQIRFVFRGRVSSVGVATRYDWTVRGSNSGGSEIFRTRPDGPLCHTQPSAQWVPGLFPGSGVDHPPHLTPRMKEG